MTASPSGNHLSLLLYTMLTILGKCLQSLICWQHDGVIGSLYMELAF